MVKRRYAPLVPEGVTEAMVRQALRSRGLTPREEETLVLRFTPVDGRRPTFTEITAQMGYTKGRASQLITKGLKRLARSHQARPLPTWLMAEIEAKDPDLASLARLPPEEQPLWFLRLPAGFKARYLERSGVRTLMDVSLLSDEELLSLPGVGPRSLRLLRRVVADALGHRRARRGPGGPKPA